MAVSAADRTLFCAKGLPRKFETRNLTAVFSDGPSFPAKGLHFVTPWWHRPQPKKRKRRRDGEREREGGGGRERERERFKGVRKEEEKYRGRERQDVRMD